MVARAFLVMTCVAAAAPALAHHGFGTFEINKTVSFPSRRLSRLELSTAFRFVLQ